MGRSGGGGSFRSGGSFGGGRSSGGFSGGGRSSRSYSSSGRSSSSTTRTRSVSSRPVIINNMGGGYRRGSSFSPRGGGSSNVTAAIITIVVIMVFLIVVFSLVAAVSSGGSSQTANTTERTALSGAVNKTDWYRDDIGWVSSKQVLIEGLEDFYKQTGVQPYVLLVPYDNSLWNGDTLSADVADAYLQKFYSDNFTDEAHFIFAYFECRNDSRSEMDGEFRYLSGYSADTIMDSEAIRILWGYFTTNYHDTSLSMEKMISKTFSQTAKSIMSKPTNGWDVMIVIVPVCGVIFVAVCAAFIIKTIARRKKEQEEYTKKILETPLETFGAEDTSELEEKYK